MPADQLAPVPARREQERPTWNVDSRCECVWVGRVTKPIIPPPRTLKARRPAKSNEPHTTEELGLAAREGHCIRPV